MMNKCSGMSKKAVKKEVSKAVKGAEKRDMMQDAKMMKMKNTRKKK